MKAIGTAPVALLAEGVDRNATVQMDVTCPSVALLAEGVDRNDDKEYTEIDLSGRPPRGGRG